MAPRIGLLSGFACGLFLAAALALPAKAQNAECLKCHAALANTKVTHAAMQKACVTCHSQLDASTTPHKSGGKAPKGLAEDVPALCIKCHERKLFEGKSVHAPVTGGLCLGCHNPHGSDNLGLLNKEPAALCLDCHPEVKKGPHVIAGFTRSGHPLGNDAKEVPDPLRPGKKFYCAACHEPHRAELPKLSRFPKGMASCQLCHKM
jgi:predicted CXXCH cytochrome family protein